ncbi:MAG: TetR/AcrR family transcriptional regulator [Actinomycetota bacterium]
MPRPSSRRRVAEVAFALFEERSYDEVTVAEIAATAGVTERTVYRTYGSKLDILLGDVGDRTVEFIAALYRQPAELGVIDALVAAVEATEPSVDTQADDLRRIRLMFSSPQLVGEWASYEHELAAEFSRWIAQRTGADADDVEVEVFAASLVAARRIAMQRWVADPGSELMGHGLGALAALRSHPLNTVTAVTGVDTAH